MNQILTLSAVAQARLIREGQLSSEELVRAHLAQIELVNPSLNAAIEILAAPALEASRRKSQGPLAGVPFSVKDSIAVAGTVSTAGTLGYRNNSPSREDATLVARLRAAGAIPIARTNLPDLLFSYESDNLIHGRTNNPYDVTRTSGGSSGGEAALIAACGSPMGLGSDAAGSVRVPAHCCGIASIKPTSGRLARTGHLPPAGGWVEAVWQIGPMARHVEDLCAMMPLLLGADGKDRTIVPMPYLDPHQIDVEKLRIAYFTSNGIVPPDPHTETAVKRAAGVLKAVERRPPGVELSYDLEMKFLAPDGGVGLREFVQSIGSECTHPLLDAWLSKHEPYATDLKGFGGIWAELDQFRAGFHEFMNDFDVVLSPVAAQPAWLHGESADEQVFRGFAYTMTYNMTGWPAAVVRCSQTPGGLPIGVQIAAAPWREDIALAVALRLEREFGGWQAAPPGDQPG